MSKPNPKKIAELPTALKNLRFVQDVIDGEFEDKPDKQKEKGTFTEEINNKDWSMQQMIDNMIKQNQQASQSHQQNKQVIITSSKQNRIIFNHTSEDDIDAHSRSFLPTATTSNPNQNNNK